MADLVEFTTEKAHPPFGPTTDFIGLEHIDKATGKLLGRGAATELRSTKSVFRPGDILYGKLRPYLAKAVAVDFGGVCSTDLVVLRPDQGVEARFVLKALLRPEFTAYANGRVSGVQHPRVAPEVVGAYEVPTPPSAEQARIATTLDELSSRLDAAVAQLKETQRRLKAYRQAVLRDAFTGKLTQAWREEQLKDPESALRKEPASVLLERIREEREKAEGKRKRRNLPPLDTSELPELPEGWAWARLGNVGQVSGGVTKNRRRSSLPKQIPYLRVANVYANELRLDEMLSIGVSDSELDRVLLAPGDLLVVEGNGSVEQIGRVALWDGSVSPCVHQNHLIKVRFGRAVFGQHALGWLLSPAGRDEVKRAASSTSGLYCLSISKVMALPVPVCSAVEAETISQELERRFSLAEALEQTLGRSLKQAEQLRQSTLRRAFEGKLVPQDPSDEPAAELLERIRAERERQAGEQRERRKAPTAQKGRRARRRKQLDLAIGKGGEA